MNTLMNTKEAKIAKNSITDLALKVALFLRYVIVQVDRQFSPLAELVAAEITDVQSNVMGGFQMGNNVFGIASHVFLRAEQTDVRLTVSQYHLK